MSHTQPPRLTTEVHKVLVVSTSHLLQEQIEDLTSLIEYGPISGFVRDHGLMVHVRAESDFTKDLIAPYLCPLFAVAAARECQWLMFDSDGPTVAFLPTYDW